MIDPAKMMHVYNGLDERISILTKERDSAWNDAITEVIALVASGKGDDQALLRQRIRALKRKEQP